MDNGAAKNKRRDAMRRLAKLTLGIGTGLIMIDSTARAVYYGSLAPTSSMQQDNQQILKGCTNVTYSRVNTWYCQENVTYKDAGGTYHENCASTYRETVSEYASGCDV